MLGLEASSCALNLTDVCKSYVRGANSIAVLTNISLRINVGEFVAIMGPSGSGKSTLLHILGLLDQPDTGNYELFGHRTKLLTDDAQAHLRRNLIGFVFQQYYLLPRFDALANVALPSLYSEGHLNKSQALVILEMLGLKDRASHKPSELSGGQQQRVAIARALLHAPKLILADEPTGNLDTKTRDEILALLHRLHKTGMTVVIVTHDDSIATQTQRVIRIVDGRIVADTPNPSPRTAASQNDEVPMRLTPPPRAEKRFLGEWLEHTNQGLMSLAANKVRTFLSILGILIGVGSVIAMLALGEGAKRSIEKELASLGSNILSLRPGAIRMGGVALESGAVTRLTLDDVQSIRTAVPGVVNVSATVNGRGQLTFGNNNWNSLVMGVDPAYAELRAAQPTQGRFFTEEENKRRSLVVLLGVTVARNLFGNDNPLGEIIRINKVNFRVIGILPEKGATTWRNQDDVVVIPSLTAMYRLLGKNYLDSVDIQIDKSAAMPATQKAIRDLMIQRHRVPPLQQQDSFQIFDMAEIKRAMSESSRIMSLLLAVIATIALLVGGIGIMNIMLVSVSERTYEIGLRKAIGARTKDIARQFLTEAITLSTLGGLGGILLGSAMSYGVVMVLNWSIVIAPGSVVLALVFSIGVGLIFGMYPARKAAGLSAIAALRRE